MAKFRVTLMDEERCLLRQMMSSGKGAARTLLHGRILLQADASPEGMGYTDEAIAETLGVSLSTIHRVRQQFVEESFEAALHPRWPRKRPDKVIITGEVEQQLIALACGEPPPGHGRWTVRVLADRLVELGYVARASRETVRQALKKTSASCGRCKHGAFRPPPMLTSCITWRTYCGCTNGPTIDAIPSCVWTKPANN
jgi:transposase